MMDERTRQKKLETFRTTMCNVGSVFQREFIAAVPLFREEFEARDAALDALVAMEKAMDLFMVFLNALDSAREQRLSEEVKEKIAELRGSTSKTIT